MGDDIRRTQDRQGPATQGGGDGAAYRTGYGAGGLGDGGDRAHRGQTAAEPNSWDAPGVTPDGHRTGSSMDGPRTATDGEGEDDPERWADGQNEEPNDG